MVPPPTFAGLNIKFERAAAEIVKLPLIELALGCAVDAVIFTVFERVTTGGLIAKVPVFNPAGTSTALGPPQPEKLDARETLIPPAGAGPVTVTVPVPCLPPTREVGVN